jgi:type II secretory pathway component HofQ
MSSVKSLRLPCVCLLAVAVARAGHAQPPQPIAGRSERLPTVPLTQLDDRSNSLELDTHTVTLAFSEPILVRDLLLQLVRGTALSIVAGPETSGTFIGDLKQVTVRQALYLVLPPFGLDFSVEGTFIRVFRREADTRIFDINYLAEGRPTDPDVFEEIGTGVQTLVSDRGVFNVDRRAGLLQVSDLPERLERIAVYLDAVHDRVHRQVQIDARIIEVELPEDASSLDWSAVAGQPATPGADGGNLIAALRPREATALLDGLAAQGKVSVLASPSVLVLNNQAALVRAALRTTFANDRDVPREAGVALSVTPQIASDGMIMLGVSPVITIDASAGNEGPEVRATRETDTVARVADGHTLVLAGFARDRETRDRRAAGAAGGWFGRSTVSTRTRVELVILLTPTIVRSGGVR